jgi:PTH2 family peptidyl-tRNA hydrolase
LKQVIVVNEALRLPCGKLAAQVAHASIGAFLRTNEQDRAKWLSTGMAKVVLACDSDEALKTLYTLATEAGFPVFLVEDAGRTVIPSGTTTCLGIGPAATSAFAPITGSLRLFP